MCNATTSCLFAQYRQLHLVLKTKLKKCLQRNLLITLPLFKTFLDLDNLSGFDKG